MSQEFKWKVGEALEWKIHEAYDYKADFLDALRQYEADNFVPDWEPEKQVELSRLKEDLHRLDECALRMAVLKPEYADEYKAQHAQAQDEIARQIRNLGISGVRAV